MQRYTAAVRRLPRALQGAVPVLSGRSETASPSIPSDTNAGGAIDRSASYTERRCPRTYHSVSGYARSISKHMSIGAQQWGSPLPSSMRNFSSEVDMSTDAPTDLVNEQYERIRQCIDIKSCPPNAWLWSLVGSCANEADIKLLFQTLQNLRRFRLSSLRLNENFNNHLCQRVAEACTRAGAYDHGLMTLWKHNTFGLTPSIASAHYLLRHAKEKNDDGLMEKVMKVLIKNNLPLQPGTADLVFRTCYNTGNWRLLSVYSKHFLKAGVKLHYTTFDIWMKFAADRGDASSIWDIQKLRTESVKDQSISSAFSCAKGFLLERKPESAAAIIHVFNEDFWRRKKHVIEKEMQNLVEVWLLKVLENSKGDKKALTKSLGNDISSMMDALVKMGVDVTVNMEQFENGLNN